MGRPKKVAPKHVEPEFESQDVPDEEPVRVIEAAPKASKPSYQPIASKAEAVRQALAEGNDSPEDGVGFIQSRYGIEMTKQTFSSYKAGQKARDAKPGAPKGKPGRKPKVIAERGGSIVDNGFVAEPLRPRAVGEEGDLLASLEALKPLIASHGADRVKRLVDLLG